MLAKEPVLISKIETGHLLYKKLLLNYSIYTRFYSNMILSFLYLTLWFPTFLGNAYKVKLYSSYMGEQPFH